MRFAMLASVLLLVVTGCGSSRPPASVSTSSAVIGSATPIPVKAAKAAFTQHGFDLEPKLLRPLPHRETAEFTVLTKGGVFPQASLVIYKSSNWAKRATAARTGQFAASVYRVDNVLLWIITPARAKQQKLLRPLRELGAPVRVA